MQIPGFPDGEISEQIVGGIRLQRHVTSEWNSSRAFAKCASFAREKQIETPRVLEIRPIGLEVMNESGEVRFAALNEGERHDAWSFSLRRLEEHGKAVDEIANCGLNRVAAEIGFRWEVPCFDLQFSTKVIELGRFRFEVGEVGICEDKIEDGDARLDVLQFVSAAVAKILAAELPVHFRANRW